jgi:CRISPR/Cas system-associated protein Cas10 (large subunit of type III CRISPR-Cas system)
LIREEDMDIRIDKDVVEFTPDSEKETKQLEALWRVIVDCARFSRKMVPIGEYLPAQKNMARFAIEGEKVSESQEKFAQSEGRYVCLTCNKYVMLKEGDQIPLCCGKLMEFYD